MWWPLLGVLLVCVLVIYEYRLRRPDFIVIYETRAGLGIRRGPFYPRHFSLPIKRATHTLQLTIDAAAAGNLELRIKLVGAAAPSLENLPALLRAGGWQSDAVPRAAEELQVMLQGLVKEFTEQHEIHSLASQRILAYVSEKAVMSREKLGLDVVSLAIQSFEPANPQIAEALRQQEHARIFEQTENLNQQARIAAARARIKADEEIAELENELELKKTNLQKARLEQESLLAQDRLQEELQRSRMRLQFEKEELEMLKSSPELLMLTPQAARLAEASQSLRNARTIISLGPQDLPQGSELLGLFQGLLQKALDGCRDRMEKTAVP